MFALLIAIAIFTTPAASAQVRITYVSTAEVDGTHLVTFNNNKGALSVHGKPSPGPIDSFEQTDCWLSWCGGATFVQNDVTYTGEWI